MQRLIVLLLCLAYFISTTGAGVHLHLCMGKVAGWSVGQMKEQKTCGQCGMEKEEGKDNGCCSDEHKWLKISDDQKLKGTSKNYVFRSNFL